MFCKPGVTSMCDQRADFWLKKSGLGLPTVEGEYK